MKEIMGVKYYSISEVEKILSVGRTTIYRYVNGGLLEPNRIGPRRYFTEQALREFLLSGKNK